MSVDNKLVFIFILAFSTVQKIIFKHREYFPWNRSFVGVINIQNVSVITFRLIMCTVLYCFQASLSDVRPVTRTSTWGSRASQRFKEMVQNRCLVAQVIHLKLVEVCLISVFIFPPLAQNPPF